MVTTEINVVAIRGWHLMFQSRSQTGHGYNPTVSLSDEQVKLGFNPVHKPVMVTTDCASDVRLKASFGFQSRSQTGHGYNKKAH